MVTEERHYPAGVKLGVDVGQVRVGLASCDTDGVLATPVSTLKRDQRRNSDISVIVREAVQRNAVEVFVGLPTTLQGTESGSAAMAREYAQLLAQRLHPVRPAVQVRLIDERLSTVSAHRSLREAGISGRKHRMVVDQVAAVGILQHAIDSQRSLRTDVGTPVSAVQETASTGTTMDAAVQPCGPGQSASQEGDDQ